MIKILILLFLIMMNVTILNLSPETERVSRKLFSKVLKMEQFIDREYKDIRTVVSKDVYRVRGMLLRDRQKCQ